MSFLLSKTYLLKHDDKIHEDKLTKEKWSDFSQQFDSDCVINRSIQTELQQAVKTQILSLPGACHWSHQSYSHKTVATW